MMSLYQRFPSLVQSHDRTTFLMEVPYGALLALD